ncbi:MAG: putative Modification methylase BamHII (N-4 cytosine-specific methyltransferase BamHII) (M.BamHII) [Candidatus Berkelbacteria bacterium Athens1014_28]|uniref:Methyltransferase n=1 Tax=Candidatus Berkelbacteria bacterium Athens1014_28 TaxID=2017145 RepID=A0A554LJQ7_9BACT|nr:MAG: putative Modification methylase BamHII (N-4 cytosine-specific methyltransferase BamHII) (M.BamHII) [Candidatus Berkelbacteria bacterium Athens1014_28]
MTVQEVADALKVNKMTIYRYIKAGKITAYRMGKDFRITSKKLDSFLDQIKTNKNSEAYILPKPNISKLPSGAKLILKDWINTIQCIDCVEGMKKLPDESIDFVVTSPPYDSVRNYNGFNYDLHKTGRELFRILKDGGMVAMVIQDQTKDFGKSLTTFRTITDWCDNIGFKLFETVIYKKHGAEGAWWTKRFRVDHEYIPIFLKGKKPQYFNKEHLKIPSKHGGKTMTGCATRLTNGQTLTSKKVTINPTKCRGTIWDYTTCGDGTRLKHQHPATFPDKIPYDLIKCFCPDGGIVFDPFIGSGTTALAAIELEKKYLGFDISKEYCELARKRISEESNQSSKLF